MIMQTRTFGRSGRQVTVMGLGLAALGRPGYITLGHADDLAHDYEVTVMAERTHRILDAAWAAGIRYFDAARSYGRAEDFLGGWLRARALPAESVMVGSKWGYIYTADWRVEADKHEIKDHTLPTLQQQWQETQAHLGGYLDLYQIHSATLESGVLENTAVLNALVQLKQAGTLIGLSLSGPAQSEVLVKAIPLTVDGVPVFDSVQATWNLLETSAGGALQAAHDAGLGVIVKEALANGRLTPRTDESGLRSVLQTQADRLHTTLDGLALAAVLAQPWATIVLSGAARLDHLESNVGALAVQWDDEAAASLAGLAEPPEAYWQHRSALAWN
ncbi:MAG: aldo/keto reductase [Anaerolineae bacterium]